MMTFWTRKPSCVGRVILGVALAWCLCSQAETAASDWQNQDAEVRFRIEKDFQDAQVPNVSLLDVSPNKASASIANWVKKNRWAKTCRVNGRLCLNFLPCLSTKPVVYTLHRNFTRFVARAVLVDGVDPNASVRFEIHTDKRPLFRSSALTAKNPVAQINVAIPPQSRQIRLVTTSRHSKNLRWAKWIDPGFMVRRQTPKVSFVRLYAPGYNLEGFAPEVVGTSDGIIVGHEVLNARSGAPMDLLFDSSAAHPSYRVYLVPKAKVSELERPWQARAGLVLETKWSRSRLRSSDRLPEFLKAFGKAAEPVGRSLVDDIQQVFPIHRVPNNGSADPPGLGGYAFYHYRGFIPVHKKGDYSFATVSNWDSYVTIDGKEVVAWPGRHGTSGGTRGQKQGTVTLTPGLHKLDYYNTSPWGTMYCLAAWKKPGEKLRPMTRTDFATVGRYRPAAVARRRQGRPYIPFEWAAVDDFRVEQAGRALVTMRFKALVPLGTSHVYRWIFDDGTGAAGASVDHVFLRPGMHRVRLEVLSDDQIVSQTVQDVLVHPVRERTVRAVDNVEVYDRVIKTRDLNRVSADDLVNLYRLAEKARRPDWEKLARLALTADPDRLADECTDTEFLFTFGETLKSTAFRDYASALKLYSRLAGAGPRGKSVTRRAAIYRAELLVNHFGEYRDALNALDSRGIGTSFQSPVDRRALSTRIHAMLGLDQATEAVEMVQEIHASLDGPKGGKQEIKHAGLLRRARGLIETSTDPNEWTRAAEMIQTVVTEAPDENFAPNVNLVRLDIHLVRQEFRGACHLAERLLNLQLNDHDRIEILSRRITALCGLKDLDGARSVYAQLTGEYPHSQAVAEAKKAIIRTFRQQ